MSDNHQKVFEFLKSLPVGLTSTREISKKTGVKEDNVRNALKNLTLSQKITKPKKVRQGSFRYIEFHIK